jgi:3-oxoacyl-[acyl-carrier-protein] synthase-3
MYHGKIVGTGSFLPDFIVTNDDLAKVVETSDDWIYTRTGIKERRIAKDYGISDMAALAAKNALGQSGVKPEEIDLIITATVSSEYSMPSVACMVQGEIGAKNAFAFDLQAACSGFVYGLDVIEQFIKTGKVKKAILIGVEKLSQVLNWEDRSTCVLFGDGAGAVVIEATKEVYGVIDVLNKSIGTDWDVLTSKIKHNDTPYYKQGEDNYLKMDGQQVFQFACKKVPEIFEELLTNNGLETIDVDLFVLHQANSRIIERVAKKMGQPIDKFYMNIEKCGNTSAATIPIALDELNAKGELTGKTVGISGFGAGLTYGAAFIQFQ